MTLRSINSKTNTGAFRVIQYADVTVKMTKAEPFSQIIPSAEYAELKKTTNFLLSAMFAFKPKTPQI